MAILVRNLKFVCTLLILLILVNNLFYFYTLYYFYIFHQEAILSLVSEIAENAGNDGTEEPVPKYLSLPLSEIFKFELVSLNILYVSPGNEATGLNVNVYGPLPVKSIAKLLPLAIYELFFITILLYLKLPPRNKLLLIAVIPPNIDCVVTIRFEVVKFVGLKFVAVKFVALIFVEFNVVIFIELTLIPVEPLAENACANAPARSFNLDVLNSAVRNLKLVLILLILVNNLFIFKINYQIKLNKLKLLLFIININNNG